MFNFLVSGNDEAWQGEPYVLDHDRVFEHTADQVRERFIDLNEAQLQELYQLPTIFAYENAVGQNAKIGRITRVRHRGGSVRIEYSFIENIPELSPEVLQQLVWELDISDWELNRTHWAVKDVDLATELINANVISEAQIQAVTPDDVALFRQIPVAQPIAINPTIFRVPDREIESDLVSVMMPFQPRFDEVFQTINQLCEGLGLRCQNANQVWEESEIIQDIFSLIYRSQVVICDFSGRNPNVFYEAGVAHTLGRPVIPIVQEVDDIPFDLRHHRHAIYQNDAQGFESLSDQIRPRIVSLTEAGA